jgi:dTDP-4-dehydrorhamnose 3,5-epimerase
MTSENNEVLNMPPGYATCLRALKENSKVMLFADYDNENAKLDDHLWPLDYFNNKQ